MANKIFVTASSGNIGSQIVKVLQTQKADFVAGISQNEASKSFGYATKVIDFADVNAMTQALKGIDTLFLLVPLHPLMVQWAKNATDAAKNAGVKHIIRSSGAGTDSKASFMMPQVQGTIDDYIRASGVACTFTAPTNFMQNFINFNTQDIKISGTIYMPVGRGKLGWVDVRDIAAVNAAILQNPSKFSGQTLMITGSENLNYDDCVVIISEVLGKKVSFVDVPEQASIDAMKQWQMPQFSIDMMVSLNQIIKAGYAEGTTNVVKELTGKEPISFRQFVQDHKSLWV